MIPRVVAALLFTAAVLKLLLPAGDIKVAAVYDLPRWLTTVSILSEITLAIGLWRAWRSQMLRLATIVLFSIFALWTLYRAVHGAESCGCFGRLTVSPWLTFVIDVGVIVALIQWRPTSRSDFVVWREAVLLIPLLVLVAVFSWDQSPANTSSAGVIESGRLTILKPEHWVGNALPIADQFEPLLDLTRGEWVILFFHHDCPACQEALPKYKSLADSQQVLLVEIPPYGTTTDDSAGAKQVRLSDEQEWFMETPCEITLSNGTVTGASTKLPAIAAHR